MNYLSVFTNDEIQEGKKCLINRMRRPLEVERLESPTTANRGHGKHTGTFQLNVQMLDPNNPPADNKDDTKEE